jgi:hypothetical protein
MEKIRPNATGSISGTANVGSKWKKAAASATAGRNNAVGERLFKPCAFHQNVLRGCNLQTVLSEAIHMDPDIAFKGSKCTVGLKLESQRRLTLVHRALLALYKAFVTANPENQELMFKGKSLLLSCTFFYPPLTPNANKS